jgi:cytochrome P450/NADPH-cytochrome P450 reductase
MTEPIPGPPGLPIIGNILDLAFEETSLRALEHLAGVYGPIYQIRLAGKKRIVCTSAELLAELTDEKRFVKMVPAALSGGTDAKGLFSAESENPDWGQSHRILMPAFGPLAIEAMFDGTQSLEQVGLFHVLIFIDMKDIANQLILKWARQGTSRISATEDFTRLTLDTIALCAMDYRFNSFYQESMHPFVDAMVNVLAQNGSRSTRPALVNKFMYRANAKFDEDEKLMKRTSQEIVDHRRAHPVEKKDLLNAMIHGVDPKTGEKLRDELIIAQMITFLIAGQSFER